MGIASSNGSCRQSTPRIVMSRIWSTAESYNYSLVGLHRASYRVDWILECVHWKRSYFSLTDAVRAFSAEAQEWKSQPP